MWGPRESPNWVVSGWCGREGSKVDPYLGRPGYHSSLFLSHTSPSPTSRPSPSPGLDSVLVPYCPWGRVTDPHPGIRGTFTAQCQPFRAPPPPTLRGHRAGMRPCTPHPRPTSPLNATHPRSLPLHPHLLWLLCPGIALVVTHPPTHTPSLFGMNS